jgi:hypothetical protein
MIRKCRGVVAASLLTAVIMSFPTAPMSEAAIRDMNRPVPTKICPIKWRTSTWHVKRLIRCAAAHYGVSRRKAIHVAWRESRFQPRAYNAAGGAAGVFQHLVKYWPDRAKDFGFREWSVFNARANVIVSMKMVRRYGWWPWGG